MKLDRGSFVRTHLKRQDPNVFSVRLNDDEQTWLVDSKRLLNEKSSSTALKMLAFIGYSVLHEPQSRALMVALFKKKRDFQTLLKEIEADKQRIVTALGN